MSVRYPRWVLGWILVCGACTDSSQGDGGSRGGGGGTAAAAQGGSSSSGRGGAGNAPSAGKPAPAGSGGSDGAAVGGKQAPGDDAGVASCSTADCPDGEHCELISVQCLRAPCPSQPGCVPDQASGDLCGSRGLADCAEGEYCEFVPGAACGAADGGGRCKTKPNTCPDIDDPVCGCDGETYSNACLAAVSGFSVASQGECRRSSPAPGSVDCDPREITCKRTPPVCGQFEVPSVDGACFGPCVGIEACQCGGPEQCPDSDQYTCHMSAKHCTPYLF